MNKDKLLEVLTPLDESFYWKKYDLTVVGDGYLEDGTRVHMVEDCMEQSIMYLSNAYVMSLPMVINEDIATEFENYKEDIVDGYNLPEDLKGLIKVAVGKYKKLGWVK